MAQDMVCLGYVPRALEWESTVVGCSVVSAGSCWSTVLLSVLLILGRLAL